MTETRDNLRQKLLDEVAAVDAAALVPHHRRGALLMLAIEVDLVETALAIATDDTATVEALIREGAIARPTLAQLADWCVDTSLRFQFLILQPYVLAQPLPRDSES